jgi:hypothetical protein
MTELEFDLANYKPTTVLAKEKAVSVVTVETLEQDLQTVIIPLVFNNPQDFIIYDAVKDYIVTLRRDTTFYFNSNALTVRDFQIYEGYVLPCETKDLFKKNIKLEKFNNWFERSSFKSSYEKLIDITRAAESIYGEDNVDLKLESLFEIKLIIRYPSLFVEDSEENSEYIKDSYICYSFGVSEFDFLKIKSDIRMFTSHGTFNQAGHGYIHSHAPTKTLSEFFKERYLCLGATDLNCLLDELESKGDISTIETEIFETLFYQVNELLVWESEEGGPYINLEELSTIGNNYVKLPQENEFTSSDEETFVHKCLENIDLLDFLGVDLGSKSAFSHLTTYDKYRIAQIFSHLTDIKTSFYDEIDGEYKKADILNHEANLFTIANSIKPYPTFRHKPINYIIEYDESYKCSEELLPPKPFINRLLRGLSTSLQSLHSEKLTECKTLSRDISENLVFV